jgi:hypothetical protein
LHNEKYIQEGKTKNLNQAGEVIRGVAVKEELNLP